MSLEAIRSTIEAIPNPLYVERHAEDLDPIVVETGCVGLAVLSKEDPRSFVSLTETYPDEICVICRDSLTKDVWDHDGLAHRCHGECIATWVQINPSCPTCRVDIDKTSLAREKILPLEVEEGDSDFEFPKEYVNLVILGAVCSAPFLLYDAIYNMKSDVLVPAMLAAAGIFANKFRNFDNHGQSVQTLSLL